jgi:hypothetical protein
MKERSFISLVTAWGLEQLPGGIFINQDAPAKRKTCLIFIVWHAQLQAEF